MSKWCDTPAAVPLPLRSYGGRGAFMTLERDHNVLFALFASFTCAAALRITDRVEQNVLTDKNDPKGFADTLMRDLNTLAITAALIAQLSVTALSLPMLSNVHWVCKAGVLGSLAFGVLSTWFSSNMARNLSSVDTSEDVKNWLSKPSGRKEQEEFYQKYVSLTKVDRISTKAQKELFRKELVGFIERNRWRKRCSSVTLLVWVAALLVFFGSSTMKDAETGILRKAAWELDLEDSLDRPRAQDPETGPDDQQTARPPENAEVVGPEKLNA